MALIIQKKENSDTVKVTLNTTPTGSNQKLRYAYTGTPGAQPGAQISGSVKGNLRDSDNTPSLYGNTLYNWSVQFDKVITVDSVAPIISNTSSIPNSSGVTITWSTNEDSSSIVEYGLTSSYGSSTSETDTSPRVSNHSVTLLNLAENTVYHYRILSKDYVLNEASSPDNTLYTLADTPTGFNFIRHPLSVDIYVDAFSNSNSGLSGYLFWRTDNSAYNSGWIQTREWRDPNMVEGQTYTYAVKYRNGDGVETATTTMGGVVFIHDSGRGGGTPIVQPQATATTTLSNTTSTVQTTSTQATSSVSFEKPINEMSKDEIIAKIAQITQMIAQLQLLLANAQPTANSTITIPKTFQFMKNMGLGAIILDVKYLQMLLNQDPDTQVAQIGFGSLGKETIYFGPLTKQAVIKFQEKYKEEILKSWGLTKGTGIVGNTTKAKLNQLLGK